MVLYHNWSRWQKIICCEGHPIDFGRERGFGWWCWQRGFRIFHISENSESDSDFEEEDEVEHHLVTKRRRVPHLQPAPGPEQAHQTASEEIWMSITGEIEWSSCPRNEPPCRAVTVISQGQHGWQLLMCRTSSLHLSFSSQIPSRKLFWIAVI